MLPESGVAAVGHGTAADHTCKVTHVKIEEPAASHGAHSRQVGSNSGVSGESVDTGARSNVQENRRVLGAMSLRVDAEARRSSKHWQGGPCTGSLGRRVPCQGVTKP